MTPTDKLRALLDERGIEYGSGFGGDTLWTGRDGIEWRWDNQENILAMYSHTITPEQAIAATVGTRTDLANRLREVTGLRSFAELFGFSWSDESDWCWHDVACAMADAIDATAGTTMTLDEATDRIERFMGDYAKVLLESTMYVERDEPTDQHAFDAAEQKEAQMARDLAEALATVGGYTITFAPTLDRPPETMVGETVYDSEGNAIGWIVNAPAEPDEATMLKLHSRMNDVLLDMNEEMLAYHSHDRENASSKKLIDCVIAAHQIIEDAAKAGARIEEVGA